MLITLKNNDNKLIVKDMLDIDYDMYVEKVGKIYQVFVNSKYRLSQDFNSEDEAVDAMIRTADSRNALEIELRNY